MKKTMMFLLLLAITMFTISTSAQVRTRPITNKDNKIINILTGRTIPTNLQGYQVILTTKRAVFISTDDTKPDFSISRKNYERQRAAEMEAKTLQYEAERMKQAINEIAKISKQTF
jgi:hypothetical protein